MNIVKILEVVVLVLGALIIKVRLGTSEQNIPILMNIVNSVALYLSLEILLFSVSKEITKFTKQADKDDIIYNFRRIHIYNIIKWGLTIALVFIIYYINICICPTSGNDIITILTLSLSMSTGLLSGIIAAFIYREL